MVQRRPAGTLKGQGDTTRGRGRRHWSWQILAVVMGAVLLGAPAQAAAQSAAILIIEGCLAAGDRPGYFTLVDDATGDRLAVAGLADLTQHADTHRERITGTFVREDGRQVLRATNLEHLSNSCTPLVQQVTQRVQQVVRELRRRAAVGIRGGFALDPELILVGGHAELSTFVEDLVFRPNFEFGIGEVTAEYAANLEGIYRLPFLRERDGGLDVWHVYVGAGPSLTFFNQEFRERDFRREGDFEFDDWDSEVGFNVLVGLTRRNGFFAELKAGAYGTPDVRMLLGYTF